MPRLNLSSRSTGTGLFLGCAGDRENDPAPKPFGSNGLNHRGDNAPKWASPVAIRRTGNLHQHGPCLWTRC